MKKSICLIFPVIMFLSCVSLEMTEREESIELAYQEITISLDQEQKQGEIILYNLMFKKSLSQEEIKSKFEHLISISEDNKIGTEIYKLKNIVSTEEYLFSWDGRSSLTIKFSYTNDVDIVLKEIFKNIIYVGNKCEFDTENNKLLKLYFYYDKEMIVTTNESEHIKVYYKDKGLYAKEYLILWERDKGDFIIQLRDLFFLKFFIYVDDVVDTNQFLK